MNQVVIIDENIPKGVADYLSVKGFKTLCITDGFLRSAKDYFIAEYAAKQGLLVLTLDSDFAQLYHNIFRGRVTVMLVKANPPTTANIIKILDLALRKLRRAELRNRLVIITKSRVRIIS